MSTINGIGSGLDIHALVKAQVEAANAPKQSQILRQKIKLETNISNLGSFTNALKNYQDSLEKLTKEGFKPYVANSSNDKVAAITIKENVKTANFKLEVTELAGGAKIASKLFANDYQVSISSNLQINLGDESFTVAVSSGDNLEQIAQNITKQLEQNGISANVVQSENGQRLVLSSSQTGKNMQLSMQSDIGDLVIDGTKIQEGSSAGVLEFARDAKFKLDGLELSSSSNKLENIISGISLDLQEIGKTDLTIKNNDQQIEKDLASFIASYNQLINVSNMLDSNDISLRRLISTISHELSTYLVDLGLVTQKDGSISKNPKNQVSSQQIATIFTKDNGVLQQMSKLCHEVIGKDNLLTIKQNNLQTELKKIDLEQENLNKQAQTLSKMLYRKFNVMDEIVGKLTSVRQSLTSMFEAMNAKNK